MTRKLSLIAVAMSAGADYERAADLVSELSPELPRSDIEAGRVVAAAVNDMNYPA